MPAKLATQLIISLFVLLSLSVTDVQAQSAGKQLYEKLNCAQCHSLEGKGGCLAPPLDGVMKTRDEAYLRLRLNKDDEASFIKLIGHPELMPHPRFKKQEVFELLAYLRTIPASNADKSVEFHHDLSKKTNENSSVSENKSPVLESNGKVIFYKSGCLSCHSVGGLGGISAPALDGVGKRHKRAVIESFIAFPLSVGAKEMPRAELTSTERQELIEFLLSLPAAKDSDKH